MVDLTTISTAIGSVKTLYEIGSSILKSDKDHDIKSKSIELMSAIADIQGKLIETQQQISSMQEELRQAREELVKKADFERYEMVEPFPGTKIYRLKTDQKLPSEPFHFICPNCKDVLGKKSVLQEGEHYAYCKNKSCGQAFELSDRPLVHRSFAEIS